MKPIWMLSGLVMLATSLNAENFYPFSHDKTIDSIHHHDGHKYQKHSIDSVITEAKDDELVKLSGEIVKKLKCSTYLFRDESGEIKVHIDNDSIPQKGLLFGTQTTIKGEVVKEAGKPLSVEADRVRYMF
ncbi:NirD/YgiW/YdeI family stress tolerance protein [Endozoicomonas sp. OPT23]|uniref:NirD/YgiW/YdeI family stress tolerance protein n=1 Tax=Endozoicomonas sp. OPT23 TaxID=2072845 RepID=UPI0018915A6C|nr:NirD/YgiW/YdeI family stress tolerance protein [Endozoicomonas sp. OPT23]